MPHGVTCTYNTCTTQFPVLFFASSSRQSQIAFGKWMYCTVHCLLFYFQNVNNIANTAWYSLLTLILWNSQRKCFNLQNVHIEVLYQRYFLRMNQNNMTSLLILLIFIGRHSIFKLKRTVS